MKLCLIGGTGFVGKNLISILENDQDVDVTVMTRNPHPKNFRSEHFQTIKGDLLDQNSLEEAFEEADTVINLAYLQKVESTQNIRAAHNLAQACYNKGIKKIIHISTAVVVGRSLDNNVNEKSTPNPLIEYEKTKLQVENILLSVLSKKCTVSILRPTAVFGAGGKNLLKLAHELTERNYLLNGIRLSLNQHRPFNLVNIENVTAAICYLMRCQKDIAEQIFIVSDDECKENNYFDVVKVLSKELCVPLPFMINIPFHEKILACILRITGRSNTNFKRVYSCQKLLKLGFKKPVTFHDGLVSFAQDFKQKYALKDRCFP